MIRSPTLLLALPLLLSGIAPSSAGTITTRIEDFTNGGGFFAEVRVSDIDAGRIRIAIDTSTPINPGLTQSDVLALWLDLADPGLLPGFSNADHRGATATRDDDIDQLFPDGGVLGAWFEDDAVASLGGNNNLNGGGGVATAFDIGLVLGLNGGRDGFQAQRTFDLQLPGLSSEAVAGQRLGLRVQSIAGGAFDAIGSAKLLGQFPDTTPPPAPIARLSTFSTLAAPASSVPTPAPWLLIGLGLLALRPWRARTPG
ncbi:hypothetical protein [Marichromatium bheemlicum]|uniref:PEP-CTERM protein-sorting domain-containing protein n=1 Tax=Marichromatium bheemlicum TaxID=365339 RepID=A0ABX1IAU6_9GAMM|nr:hypothetical protein [Marichromatium bheemlicum]NKN34637.1 hypothetical protein [Marichromatium bheemlicum]